MLCNVTNTARYVLVFNQHAFSEWKMLRFASVLLARILRLSLSLRIKTHFYFVKIRHLLVSAEFSTRNKASRKIFLSHDDDGYVMAKFSCLVINTRMITYPFG